MEASGSREERYNQQIEAEARQRGIDPKLYSALKIALGTAAYCGIAQQILADPVRFDNPPLGQPGHYEWAPAPGWSPDGVWLDITHDSRHQQHYGFPGGFEQIYFHSYTQPYYASSILGGDGFGIANSQILEDSKGLSGFADPLDAGTLVGPNSPFDPMWNHNSTGITNWYNGDLRCDLPEDVPVYLGARWWIGNQANQYFGWIEVERDSARLEALSWGFETFPNTPIPAGAPEPDALGEISLGLLAMGYMTRRERRQWLTERLRELRALGSRIKK